MRKYNLYYRFAKSTNSCLLWINNAHVTMYSLCRLESVRKFEEMGVEVIYKPQTKTT